MVRCALGSNAIIVASAASRSTPADMYADPGDPAGADWNPFGDSTVASGTCPCAMSRRKWAPWKLIALTPRYALFRASGMVGPSAVTVSTRPPAVTRVGPERVELPLRRETTVSGFWTLVPAWKTVTPGNMPACSSPVTSNPVSYCPGYPPDAITTVTDRIPSFTFSMVGSSLSSAQDLNNSKKSQSSSGRTAWVSGSPNRQLNSSTLIWPSSIMRPA
mmetsp:Transcript_64096/g.171530  ORF Transcript_64096/g.171530 Transcript_64096/m.171530 type:complete len:218 (+) Transcript_64096:823-1476(+)